MPTPTRRIVMLADQPHTLSGLHTIELQLGPNGELPTEFRVFSKGAFETKKGTFTFDDIAAAHVLAAAKDYGNDFVIDYCHGTLDPFAMDPSLSGKAAGWIPNAGLQLRDGELWATGVTWTPPGAEALKARAYRYLSPAFRADENSRIFEFLNIALTNIPATKRMDPLMAHRAGESPTEDRSMSLKAMLVALGLAETTTETDAVAHAARLRELVQLTGKTNPSEALGVVQGWKLAAEQTATLSTKVQQLEGEVREREVLGLVDAAVKDGKLTPGQKDWAVKLGRADVAQLKGFLETAVPVPAATTQTKPPTEQPVALGGFEADVARQLGIDPKKMAQTA